MWFDKTNLPYWILLSVGLLLFFLVIFSGGGEDDLDVDADGDLDLDADAEIDADGDLDLDGEASNFTISSLKVLGWLGIGQAPLILLLGLDFSLWGVLGWTANVFVGELTGHLPLNLLGLGGFIFLSSGTLALAVGKLCAKPLGQVFSGFGEDVSSDRLIGCEGIVTSKTIPPMTEGKFGQADVIDPAKNLLTIDAALPHWATVIPHRGQKILVIEQSEHCYIAIAKDSSDEDKWRVQP
jgi:hypothetical protein